MGYWKHKPQKHIEAQPEGTTEVSCAWQGGEPTLLPISFFEKALKFQGKYKRTEIKISNALQTNGILITLNGFIAF